MLLYLFRFIKVQILLKKHPKTVVPPDYAQWFQETVGRIMERERIKEEWVDVRKAQELKEICRE